MRFLIRTAVTAFGLWIATVLLDGITVTGSGLTQLLTLLAVAVIFGVVNAVIKPLVQVLGCLFYVATLGLIAFVVNALLFLLVDRLAALLDLPFHVASFWTAFWGAIIVGLVSWLINLAFPEPRPSPPPGDGDGASGARPRVIDG